MKSLREKALDFLARREHSRLELSTKLNRYEASIDEISALLNDLESDNLVNDERFAEVYLRTRSKVGFGPYAIRAELEKRGIASDLFEQASVSLQIDWDEVLQFVWYKKYKNNPRVPQASQIRFLSQRGFDISSIYNLLNNKELDEIL